MRVLSMTTLPVSMPNDAQPLRGDRDPAAARRRVLLLRHGRARCAHAARVQGVKRDAIHSTVSLARSSTHSPSVLSSALATAIVGPHPAHRQPDTPNSLFTATRIASGLVPDAARPGARPSPSPGVHTALYSGRMGITDTRQATRTTDSAGDGERGAAAGRRATAALRARLPALPRAYWSSAPASGKA
jgi:hypothetical protein